MKHEEKKLTIHEHLKNANRKRKKLQKHLAIYIRSIKIKRSKAINLRQSANIGILNYPAGIGDLIVSTGFIRELHSNGYKVTMFASKKISTILVKNPYIHQTINIDTKTHKISEPPKEPIDLLIDPFWESHKENLIPKFKAIRSIKPKHCISFNKNSSIRLYDESIEYKEFTSHVTQKFLTLLKHLKIDHKDLDYDIFPQEDDKKSCQEILNNHHYKKLIIFCPFASTERRSLSPEQTEALTAELEKNQDCLTAITGEAHKLKNIKERKNVIKIISTEMIEIAPYLQSADLIISVDTSMVHLAKAFKKRLICIYSSEENEGFEHNHVWGPGYENAVQIIAPNKAARNLSVTALMKHIHQELKKL